jgi:hypothetical protein
MSSAFASIRDSSSCIKVLDNDKHAPNTPSQCSFSAKVPYVLMLSTLESKTVESPYAVTILLLRPSSAPP